MNRFALFAVATLAALAAMPASAVTFTVTAGNVSPIAGTGNDFTGDLAALGFAVKELQNSTVTSNGGTYKVELLGYENGFTDRFSVDGGATALGNVTWSGFANLFANPTFLGTSSNAPSGWRFLSAQSGSAVVGNVGFSIFGPAGTQAGDVFKTNTLFIGFNDGGADGDHDDGILKISAVPEPASWALMIVGFGMVGVGVRSRKRGAVTA